MVKKTESTKLDYPMSAYGSTAYSFVISAEVAGNKINKQLLRSRIKQGHDFNDIPGTLQEVVDYLTESFKLAARPSGVVAIHTDINVLLFAPFVEGYMLPICAAPLYPWHHKPLHIWTLDGEEITEYKYVDPKGVVHEVSGKVDKVAQ